MNDERLKIAAKIRALLSKTEDKGCTEAEALAAAEKAAELMTEHDLSFADVREVQSDRYGFRRRKTGGGTARRRHWHEVHNCYNRVGKLFDCVSYQSDDELVFFGAALDTEMAHYLMDVIRSAMNTEWNTFKVSKGAEKDKRDGSHPKSVRANFMLGFTCRINLRLIKLYEDKNAAKTVTTTGRELVVCKQAIVKSLFKTTGPKLVSAGGGGSGGIRESHNAFNAGLAAGGNVDLNKRGIGANVQRKIGS